LEERKERLKQQLNAIGKRRMRMKRLLMLLVAFVLFSGFTLQWDPVTTYTDNTAITNPVTYKAWMDGTPTATGITATYVTISNYGSGVPHLLEVAASVDNVDSARAGLNWTSPLATPAHPLNLRVVP
jgi:ABC-type glycerol-3-phosphate transport system permease component